MCNKLISLPAVNTVSSPLQSLDWSSRESLALSAAQTGRDCQSTNCSRAQPNTMALKKNLRYLDLLLKNARQKRTSISTVRFLLPARIYRTSPLWNLEHFAERASCVPMKMPIELALTSLPVGRLEFGAELWRCLPFCIPTLLLDYVSWTVLVFNCGTSSFHSTHSQPLQ